MTNIFLKYRFQLFDILLITIIVLLLPGTAFAQEAISLESRNRPIPKGYQTYSIFLISNPDWLLPESEEKLVKLYDRFKAFGDAIGRDHLAVWFFVDQSHGDLRFNTDVMRSSAFCSKLKLPPSKSPYVVVTDEYPGAGLLEDYPNTFNELKNYSILELNTATASEITSLLANLADQLLINGLPDTNPKTENFWRTFQKSYETARGKIISFSKGISLTINTAFFKIKIQQDPNKE